MTIFLQQGQLVELTISDLNDEGDGVGRLGGRVVFVPDTVTYLLFVVCYLLFVITVQQ